MKFMKPRSLKLFFCSYKFQTAKQIIDFCGSKSTNNMFYFCLPAAYDIVGRHTTEVVQHPLAGALPVVDAEICLQLELYSPGHPVWGRGFISLHCIMMHQIISYCIVLWCNLLYCIVL